MFSKETDHEYEYACMEICVQLQSDIATVQVYVTGYSSMLS